VRHGIPPTFIGDRDLGEAGAEIGGLGDHPHPGLGAEPAGDDPADVVIVDRRGRRLLDLVLLRSQPARQACHSDRDAEQRACEECFVDAHRSPPRSAFQISYSLWTQRRNWEPRATEGIASELEPRLRRDDQSDLTALGSLLENGLSNPSGPGLVLDASTVARARS